MLNILFMGTPDFAVESLKKIYEENYNVLGVITNPDRPKGRGMKMLPSPVKEYALEKNFPIYQPDKVKGNIELLEQIKELNPDVICVVAYGKILPKELLEIPKMGCINVHGSILPKYRGAAPIQWAVLNGDKTTGITTIFMNEKMDAGDIILTRETNIGEDETTGELWNRLSIMGAEVLIDTLKLVEANKVIRIKQPEEYTLAPMLKKEMAKIEWDTMKAEKIKNLVRGLNPIMGAYSFYEGKKVKFWKVKIPDEVSEENSEAGTIISANEKEGLYIKTLDNKIISVLEIQAENSRKMEIKEFLRGNKLEKNKKFT